MNFLGLIPIVCGSYLWLYAYGKAGSNPDSPAYANWYSRFGRLSRAVAPIVVIFGFLQLFGVLRAPEKQGLSEELKKEMQEVSDGGSVTDPETGTIAKIHSKEAGTKNESGWYEVTSTDGAFIVELPFPAVDSTFDLPKTTDGAEGKIYMVGVQSQEGVKFTVTCTERSDHKLPPDIGEKTLGSLSSSPPTPVTRGTLSGFRLSFERTGTAFEGEMFVVEGKAYQLMLEYPAAMKSQLTEISKKFFSSFRLHDSTDKRAR